MVVKHILGWVRSPQVLIVGLVAILVFSGFAFSSSTKTSVSSVVHEQRVLATKSPIKRPDCSAQACIALTFDDGPDPVITPLVLDILKRHNARSTFFVLGYHVQGNEAILKRIHQDGHEIGNHSWAHPRFTQLTPEQIQNEINSTQEVIAKAGVPAPHLFRPPYGDMNAAVQEQVPLTVVRWNIDPEDWHPNKKPYLLEHMAAHARHGGVVVMHDTEATTAERLEQLLAQLEASSYSFVTVSELLNVTPGQRGVYFNR